MRLLVCGGREFDDRELLDHTLRPYWPGIDPLIHGAGRGADTLAGAWARFWGVREAVFSAEWEIHGRAAGPIRNQQMINFGQPDLVIAFPGGAGTADLVARARKAGVDVIEVDGR